VFIMAKGAAFVDAGAALAILKLLVIGVHLRGSASTASLFDQYRLGPGQKNEYGGHDLRRTIATSLIC
jgi:hypothetical protein